MFLIMRWKWYQRLVNIFEDKHIYLKAYTRYQVCAQVFMRWCFVADIKVARILISVSFGHDIRNNYRKFIIVCCCLWFVMSKYRFTEKDLYKYRKIHESDQKMRNEICNGRNPNPSIRIYLHSYFNALLHQQFNVKSTITYEMPVLRKTYSI